MQYNTLLYNTYIPTITYKYCLQLNFMIQILQAPYRWITDCQQIILSHEQSNWQQQLFNWVYTRNICLRQKNAKISGHQS